MATHSRIVAWRIPLTEEPGRLQSMGSHASDMTQRLNHHHHVGSLPLVPPGTPLYIHTCTLIHRWTNKFMWINSVYNRCTGLPGSSVVKNLPVKQEMRVLSLGKEIPWRTKWQPTSVFLPGKSHRQRILQGYSPWDCKRVGHGLGTKQQRQHNRCTHTQLAAYSSSRVRLFATTWTVAHKVPLSIGFSRQEYWSGFLCPPPRDLPDPGMEPRSPALQADSLLLSHQGTPPRPYTCTIP